MLKAVEEKIKDNKDALEAVAKSVTKKSKLEEAAENAVESADGEMPEEVPDDFGDIDPVVNAEEDFEEFTPAE